MVSKTNITYNGWTGVGYIIIDPDTGAGAYMISGGMSGGWILGLALFAIAVFFFISAIAATGFGPIAGAIARTLAYNSWFCCNVWRSHCTCW